MDVAAKVKEIIIDKLGVEESQITPTASFTNDLGADSLDIVELVMGFESAFDISIPDVAIAPGRGVEGLPRRASVEPCVGRNDAGVGLQAVGITVRVNGGATVAAAGRGAVGEAGATAAVGRPEGRGAVGIDCLVEEEPVIDVGLRVPGQVERRVAAGRAGEDRRGRRLAVVDDGDLVGEGDRLAARGGGARVGRHRADHPTSGGPSTGCPAPPGEWPTPSRFRARRSPSPTGWTPTPRPTWSPSSPSRPRR